MQRWHLPPLTTSGFSTYISLVLCHSTCAWACTAAFFRCGCSVCYVMYRLHSATSSNARSSYTELIQTALLTRAFCTRRLERFAIN